MTNKQTKTESDPAKKGAKLPQGVVPGFSLAEAERVPEVIYRQYAGDPTSPIRVASALGSTAGSGRWRGLAGAAIAFGLIEGGAFSDLITLTQLGRRVVAPTSEGDDVLARREAALKPTALRSFLQKYDKKPFPNDQVAKNVLELECGVPRERLDRALQMIRDTASAVGFLEKTPGGDYVMLDGAAPSRDPGAEDSYNASLPPSSEPQARSEPAPNSEHVTAPVVKEANRRVFISHGKDKAVVDHIKEIVTYGNFVPVVSVEHETTSLPVPEKVMNDMRSCTAGVIHVSGDMTVVTEDGKPMRLINQNVLIEIGAAMALFDKNFILLVGDGVDLPSNLQGLYEVRYQGDKLDGEATMKLLKAFNAFRI